MIAKPQLYQALQQFPKGRVLVVGDLVIDEMIYGSTHRLSREAPVLILKHQQTDIILGAAGNAAHNIADLGAKRTTVIGVAGKDYYCSLLIDALQRDGVDYAGLVQDDSRPTSTKTRLSGIANHSVTQQVVRIDRESNAPLSSDIENRLLDHLTRLAPEFDAILLSDYGLGVLSPAIIEQARVLARKHNLVLAVDSQKSLDMFQGATVLTPNQPEAEQNVGYDLETHADLVRAGQELLVRTAADNMLITRGAAGMALFEKTGRMTEIPAFNRSEVFDVTGAGDTVVGTLTLALATGSPTAVGAVLGNLAASIVVKRFGAATTNPAELAQAIDQLEEGYLESILVQRELQV